MVSSPIAPSQSNIFFENMSTIAMESQRYILTTRLDQPGGLIDTQNGFIVYYFLMFLAWVNNRLNMLLVCQSCATLFNQYESDLLARSSEELEKLHHAFCLIQGINDQGPLSMCLQKILKQKEIMLDQEKQNIIKQHVVDERHIPYISACASMVFKDGLTSNLITTWEEQCKVVPGDVFFRFITDVETFLNACLLQKKLIDEERDVLLNKYVRYASQVYETVDEKVRTMTKNDWVICMQKRSISSLLEDKFTQVYEHMFYKDLGDYIFAENMCCLNNVCKLRTKEDFATRLLSNDLQDKLECHEFSCLKILNDLDTELLHLLIILYNSSTSVRHAIFYDASSLKKVKIRRLNFFIWIIPLSTEDAKKVDEEIKLLESGDVLPSQDSSECGVEVNLDSFGDMQQKSSHEIDKVHNNKSTVVEEVVNAIVSPYNLITSFKQAVQDEYNGEISRIVGDVTEQGIWKVRTWCHAVKSTDILGRVYKSELFNQKKQAEVPVIKWESGNSVMIG